MGTSGKRYQKLFVLLFVLVTLLCGAAGAFAEPEPYKVNVEFLDFDKQPHPFEGDWMNMWVYVEIKQKPAEGVNPNTLPRLGWNSSEAFNPRNSTESSFSFTFDKFGSIDPNGDGRTPDVPDNSITFDPTQYIVSRIRVYHGNTKPTYYNVRETNNSWEKPDDSAPNGYKIIGSDPGPTEGTTRMHQWGDSFLNISINLDPAVTTTITQEDGYWVRVKLEHASGTETYYVTRLVTNGTNPDITPDGNTLKISANTWRNSDGNVQSTERFTGNEPSVTVQIVKTVSSAEANQVARLDQTNPTMALGAGSFVKDYQIVYPSEYPDGKMVFDSSNTHDDDPTHTTISEYNFSLTPRSDYETALTPEDVLGDAANFGIVADRYDQFGHSETNFAVNHFFDTENIDIDGSGDTPIPFYVADLTDTARDGTVTNTFNKTNDADPNDTNNKKRILWLSNKTTVPVDIFAATTDATPEYHNNEGTVSTYGKIRITSPKPATIYPTESTQISNYVNSLITNGKTKSNQLASKANLTPEYNAGGDFIVDTTGFPDGTTIYVNADGFLKSIGKGGWKINKLPNQSIVFNINAESNDYTVTDNETKQSKAALQIGKFYVYPNDGGARVESTTSAMNGDKALNQRVDDVILSHIFFNVTTAEYVHLENASGLFLLPEATQVTQSNGAGWILAEGTVDSHTEWHFYRHTRNYVAKGGFKLSTQKTLVDGTGNPIAYENKNFKFELYELDADGNIIKTPDENNQLVEKPVETQQADKDGLINFLSFSYNDRNVPFISSPKTFNYKIMEVIPDDAVNSQNRTYAEASDAEKAAGGFVKDGITYNAEPILVKVIAANTRPSGTATEGEISLEIWIKKNSEENWTKVENSSAAEETPVYDLIPDSKVFTNKNSDNISGSLYLGATKTMENDYWPGVTPSFPFELTGQGITDKLTGNAGKNTPAVFGPINYTEDDLTATATADYTYIIKENCPADYAQKGITCSTDSITVSVKLKEENGTIVPEYVKVGNEDAQTETINGNTVYIAGSFTNSYSAKGSVVLGAEKLMQGGHWPAENHVFKFKIEGADDRSRAKIPATGFQKEITISSNGTPASGTKLTKAFGTINFTLADVTATAADPYRFTISELPPDEPYTTQNIDNVNYYVKDGVYYYADPITVNIKATDNGDGKIYVLVNEVRVTGTEYDAGITNAYHEDGTIQLMVTKSLGQGSVWPKGRTFEFKLTGTDEKSTKLLQDNNIHNAIATSTAPASFGSIKISETNEGTYNFKITEVVPTGAQTVGQNKVLDGVTYIAPFEKTFSLTFSDDGTGNIIVHEDGHQDVHTSHTGDTVAFTVESFTNAYEASGKLKLGVLKGIDNWPANGKFNFEITGPKYDNTNNTALTQTPGQPAVFGEITFTQDDLKSGQPLTYTIKETGGSVTCAAGHENCVTYNTTDAITVTVTLSDDGHGTIIPVVQAGSTTIYQDSQTGVFTVGTISGNTYTANGKAELLVEKTMLDKHWPAGAHSFTFTLAGDDVNSRKLIDPDGSKKGKREVTLSSADLNTESGILSGTFGEINFTLADVTATANPEGHYHFTLTENPPEEPFTTVTENGITYKVKNHIYYSTARIRLEMWFTDDGNGNVRPSIKVDGESGTLNGGSGNKFTIGSFTNAYHEEGTFQLAVTKVFENDVWPTGKSFEFKLTPDANTETLLSTTQNTLQPQVSADSTHKTVSFGSIKIDNTHDGKTYKFTLEEVVPAGAADDGNGNKVLDGVTYKPPFTKDVTITFNDDGNGNVIPSVDGLQKDGVTLNLGTFTNSYAASGALQIKAVKTLEGNAIAAGQFSFDLHSSDGTYRDEKSNDEKGNIVFTPIAYALSDAGKTYTYILDEENSGRTINGVIYSSQEYTITAVLSNQNGIIVPDVSVRDKDGKDVTSEITQENGTYVLTITDAIVNTYTASGSLRLRSAKTVNDMDGITDETHDDLPFELWYQRDWDNRESDSTLTPFMADKPHIVEDERTPFIYDIEYTLENPAVPAATAAGVPRVSLPGLVESKKIGEPTKVDGKDTYTVDYFLTELTIVDRELKEPDQSFKISVTLTDNGDGSITPTSLTVTEIKGGQEQTPKTFNAEEIKAATETGGEDSGVLVGEFFNTERTNADLILIHGAKQLDGHAPDGQMWTFTISANDKDAPMPVNESGQTVTSVQNDNGTFTFPSILFTPKQLGECFMTDEGKIDCEAKVYTYTISETSTINGIDNDAAKTFKVRVSLNDERNVHAEIIDPADGKLESRLTFINHTHETEDAEVELQVTKIFDGEWPEEGFTFVLTRPDNMEGRPETDTVTVTKDRPTASFGKIKFTPDDLIIDGSSMDTVEFVYVIREVIPDGADEKGVYNGIRYDKEAKTVTIRLSNIDGFKVEGPSIITTAFTNKAEKEEEHQKTPTAPRFFRMPETGFSAVRPTALTDQPKDLNYNPLRWTLEIPSLGLMTEIVEVPLMGDEYPVTWLGDSAGLLQGYSLPGRGTSILTGHNHLNTTEAGPFALLKEMGIGDRIFVLDPQDNLQSFSVYANERIDAADIAGLERIASRFADAVTLLTCEDEMPEGGYAHRRVIAAKPIGE